MKAAFQGELGSNGHELCLEAFPDYEPYPCATFADAFAAVREGECAVGVIAMENSTAGRVADVHNLLPNSGLRIVGERFKKIDFQAIGAPGAKLADAKIVRSHAMALPQCQKWIAAHGLKAQVALDTAGAVRELSERPDPTVVALAPRLAAEIYGLPILAENVQDDARNTTRFIVITADPSPPEPPAGSAAITSLMFKTRNVPAALFKSIGSFASNGVNLWKLESYLEGHGRFRAASFYAEISGRPGDDQVRLALEELAFFTSEYSILGVYAADPARRQDLVQAPMLKAPPAQSAADVHPLSEPAADAGEDWREALVRHRHSIDNIDAAVIHLLAERFKTTRQVGALKAQHGLASTDRDRETQQLERLRRLAAAAQLDPGFAEKFLAFIIAEVIRHHDEAKGA